ncbi:MAG: hypothetical protein ACLQU3_29035 [Limisphaerales bacterium]
MNQVLGHELAQGVPKRLVELLAVPLSRVKIEWEPAAMRGELRGENVWLVVPNDEGVSEGAAEGEGIRCVHPVQAYLDMKDHPERSAEAAEQLR